MNTTHIAVDLAKSVFQLAVSHSPGKVAEEHRLPRTRFRNFFLHRPPSHVLMEACGSAHHWGRELEAKANGLKDQLQRLGSQIPTVQYLLTVPGIGTLSAKARGHNIATVALANRIARIAWRVWRDQRPFQRCPRVQEVPA